MVRYILLIALALMLLSGCDDFTAGPRFDGDVYSIAAMLVSGKSISMEHPVYITRSTDIGSFDPMNIFVTEAEVKITELDSKKSWNLSLMLDIEELKLKWVDENNNIIQPEFSYRIEVQVPGYDLLISAETTVPPAVEVNPDYLGHNVDLEGYTFDPQNMGYLVYDQSDLRYPVAVNTFDNGGSFNFRTEFYCLEPFSTDLEFTYPVFGATNPTEEMEDVYYSTGEGLRRINFLSRMTSQVQPEHSDNYILLRDYRQAFIFYGRYRVSAYITDDNYYRYQYTPEGYLYGGVENALGYFGSASGAVMYVKVVKQAPAI